MEKEINVGAILKEIRTNEFILNCKMPVGYTNGLPILQIKNNKLCLLIPYLMYKATGVVDKTLVFPIKYAVTVSIPEKDIVGFEDLSFDPAFKSVDFSKATGFFRHDAVKQFNKTEYKHKRKELLSMYDKIASAILYGSEYTEEDDKEFKELLNIMLEPSLKPIYQALDVDFYNKYLT